MSKAKTSVKNYDINIIFSDNNGYYCLFDKIIKGHQIDSLTNI